MPIDEARKAALRAKFGDKFENRSQIGGKGTMRRKKRTVRKKDTQDDKRLQGALKRLCVNNIPAIEEVNLFRKGDDTVIHFNQPRVQASIAANTYVVSGNCETKKVMEMLPSILPQLGPDNLENLKDMASQIQKLQQQSGAAGLDDDDEVPDLVENVNFEDVAAEEVVVQDDAEDDDDDDIPDLVETANFDDHVPIAVSTEPNPEDNLVSTEPNPEDEAVVTEPNPEDNDAPVAVSTEPNPEDDAVGTESNPEDIDAPVAVSTEPNPEDNAEAAVSSEPDNEENTPAVVSTEAAVEDNAAAPESKEQKPEEKAATNSADVPIAISTEPDPEDSADKNSGDEDPILADSTEKNAEDNQGTKAE